MIMGSRLDGDGRGLEENTLERRLERPPLRFADPETKADLRLGGAMHLDFAPAAEGEHGADRARRQLRGITIPAEMAKHHPFEFPAQQLVDYGRSRFIRKMTVAGLDPLFHRPRPMGIVLQKLFVVIGLDHEGMHFAEALDHGLGRVTEIGDEPKRAFAGVKRVPDRIDGVVRDRKSLDVDIADRKLGASLEKPPIPVFAERTAPDRFRGERVAINGNVKFPAEHFEPANVVAMFVGEEDAIELGGRDSALGQAKNDLTRAQASIDQEPAMIRGDERTVSGAAAAEHGQGEHALISNGRGLVSQTGNRNAR
jgi:hypothetical protein